MKTLIPCIIATALVSTVTGEIASAKPVSAVGDYADAHLEGARATTGVAPAPPLAALPAKASASAAAKPAAKPAPVTAQVKAWVNDKKVWAETKITELKNLWGSWTGAPKAAPKPVQVAANPAAAAKAQPVAQPAAQPAAQNNGAPASGAQPSAPSVPGLAVPSVPAVAYVPPPAPPARKIEEVGGRRNAQGVPVFDIKVGSAIPRLDIEREQRFKSSRFFVEGQNKVTLEQKILHPFETPDLLTEKQMKELAKGLDPKALDPRTEAMKVKDVEFQPKGKVSREGFDRLVIALKSEKELQLTPYKPLTVDEMRFLAGLLLYQKGDKCASAVGLFHWLARNPDWQAEADYYLAMCSRTLGLESDFIERTRRVLDSGDTYFSRKILKELKPGIPNEMAESFGASLLKAVSNKKNIEGLDAKAMGTIAYLLSIYGAQTENYKVTLAWAKQVPETHPKHLESQFLLALAEYQAGSKENALKIEEKLVGDIKTEKAKDEFQAVVALNAARMFFQERSFKQANSSFLKVAKDHPLWLQSLTEMGWSQLMSGDYEGAIGNMYSIQSPFFAAVYKPESFVIRTIGYLNLCQYGDAYRTLSILERDYRPQKEAIDRFVDSANSKPGIHYQAVRTVLTNRDAKEAEGLPAMVVREMARHKEFINLQKAMNRELDERAIYGRLDAEIDRSVKQAQYLGESSRRRLTELKKGGGKGAGPTTGKVDSEANRVTIATQLENETRLQEEYSFMESLFGAAKSALPAYRKDMTAASEKRTTVIKTKIEKALASRLHKIREDLGRILENNELLRYEVFSGSGENIRFQVAGGEKGNRVPASVLPKSKSLQWNFDGEYWEDEIGHYRSSLKNNCPDAIRREAARAASGGAE